MNSDYRFSNKGVILYYDVQYPTYPEWAKDGTGIFATDIGNLRYKIYYYQDKPVRGKYTIGRIYPGGYWKRTEPPILVVTESHMTTQTIPIPLRVNGKEIQPYTTRVSFSPQETILKIENASPRILQKLLYGGLDDLLMERNL